MFTITLEHSRPPNNGNRGALTVGTLPERRTFKNRLLQNVMYSFFFINFVPSFRKQVNLFHCNSQWQLLISREDVVKEIYCLYIYFFFDGAGILATQIQHIIINKVSTYYISLVSPSSINSFSMGEFFFLTLVGKIIEIRHLFSFRCVLNHFYKSVLL